MQPRPRDFKHVYYSGSERNTSHTVRYRALHIWRVSTGECTTTKCIVLCQKRVSNLSHLSVVESPSIHGNHFLFITNILRQKSIVSISENTRSSSLAHNDILRDDLEYLLELFHCYSNNAIQSYVILVSPTIRPLYPSI